MHSTPRFSLERFSWEVWLALAIVFIPLFWYFFSNQNSFTGLLEPTAMAAGQNDQLYILDRLNRSVQQFDSEGHLVRSWGGRGKAQGEFSAELGEGPDALTVDPAGNLYISDPANRRVEVFDGSGHFLRQVPVEQLDSLVEDSRLGADSQGNLYLVAPSPPFIHKFDAQGRQVASWGTLAKEGGQFSSKALGLAVSPGGQVYVSENNSQELLVFDGQGHLLARWQLSAGKVLGLDGGGNLYTLSDGLIHKYDREGNPVKEWSSSSSENHKSINITLDLAVDRQGKVLTLHELDGGIYVQKFDAEGRPLSGWAFRLPFWIIFLRTPLQILMISTGMGLLVNLGRKRKMQLALRREAPEKAMPAVWPAGEEEERLNLDELGGVERRRKVRLVLTLILITVLILVLPGVMAVLAIDIAFDRTTNFFSGFYLFGLAAVLIPLVLIVFLNVKEQKARKQLEARVEANELQSQVADLTLPTTGSSLAGRVTGFGLVIISVVLFVFTPTALQGVLAQAVSLIDRLASNPAGSVVFGLVFAALAGILLLPALLSAFLGGPGKLLKRDLRVLAGLALRLVAVYTLIVFICHLVILATVQPGYVQSLNGARGDQLGFTAGITAFGLLLAGIYLTPYLWVKAGWNSGDYPTALRRSLFLRKLTVEGTQAVRLYSETLFLKGSYLEGESFTRGILRLYRSGKTPLTPAIIVHLGRNLAGQGRYYEAVEALENALRLDPKNGRGYSSLAGTYLSWGREPERARKLLEQGYSRCKHSLMVRLLERRVWGEILANQAWALARLGRSEEARQKLSQALRQGDRKMQPALAMLHYYGSQVKEVEGEIEGARQALEEALRLDPDGAAGKLAAQRLDNAG